jgi:hypothetical protein
MKNKIYLTLASFAIAAAFSVSYGQQNGHNTQTGSDCPMMKKQTSEMNARGNTAMGFDQAKTVHHFHLTNYGGIIEVQVKKRGRHAGSPRGVIDPRDTESRDQIREHLQHITRMFSEGNFNVPMFIHAQVPPGVDVMQRLKDRINYEYVKSQRGALLRISTTDAETLEGVHNFLKFQIVEHQTGDPLEVHNNRRSISHPGNVCIHWVSVGVAHGYSP